MPDHDDSEFYCDVVVVGAGPGGSMAAKYAALEGLDVILIEKKAEIGSPLRCAEGISRKWLSEIGIDPDPAWICSEIMGMRITSPSGAVFASNERGPDGSGRGYVLERHLFDKALARQAADAGARIMMRTACRDVIRDRNGKLIGIRADSMGRPVEIYAGCVVAADGFESQVARWAGVDTTLELDDIDTCMQYRMTNIDIDPQHCEFLIGSAAPGGYIWIFPKGDGTANVGIGVQASKCSLRADPKYHLDKFIANDPRLRNGQVLEAVAGGVSTRVPTEHIADNLIIIGDAARSINPLTGGGVHEAAVSGMYAGKVISDCFSKKDLSKEALQPYVELWEGTMGEKFRRNQKVKQWFSELSDEALDELITSISGSGINRINMGEMLKFLMSEGSDSILRLGLS